MQASYFWSETSIRFLALLGMTGVLRLSSRAAQGEARLGREGSGSTPPVIQSDSQAKHASAAKDLGVPHLSSRAAQGEARLGREGSGREMSTGFLALLPMTEPLEIINVRHLSNYAVDNSLDILYY
ncbi:MAG: hypothetical protein PHV77_02435 [Candidatus Omnitrophica bacterium]|nr:hypothetical protein [Candidatus Omnitrophota bacterium]